MNRFFVPLLLAVVMLSACTGVPQRPVPPADTLTPAAQALVDRGDYLSAAQLYLNESKTAAPERSRDLRLEAARLLARGALWEPLAKLLASIDPETLSAQQRAEYVLLEAELALARHQSEQALDLLQTITSPETLPDLGQRYYSLRADAYALAGNALEAARQRVWLDGLIADSEARLENQYRIWEQLSGLSDPLLQQMLTAPPPDPLSGWMELVMLSRQTRGEGPQWDARLNDWRLRYPAHPAEAALLPDLLMQIDRLGTHAGRIAVLLPLSGRTAESAAAIRDGILAAYFSQTGDTPELQFYDTAGDARLVWSVYQQAIQDGAGFVIGPLLKESIQQLAQSGYLPVPVLALNHIGETQDGPERTLYQFGLAPEDEARQVAERIYSDGHQNVIALVPESQWGQRVFDAFARRFGELGGEVLDSGRYALDSADYRRPIQGTLNLDASHRRHTALERQLGQKLHYEPRRRQDADAIFMLGFAKQARQIKPQLRFHHAGDIPVYSTSHVYDSGARSGLDRDMDGIIFCDIPWLLDKERWPAERRQHDAAWPQRSEHYQRLFALGFDAYQVIPWLDVLDMPGFSSFPGTTGVLTLDQNGNLHRSLQWAQFHAGAAKKLTSTPPEQAGTR